MTGGDAEVAELPTSPGARLRRERESRDLTEQQAAEQLNLDVSVVLALEADDFGSLGAPVFAKGHLRRYATMLGLPADELLAGYERSRGQPEQPTLIPRSRVEMMETMPVRSRPKWPWVLGGALAFLLAAALAAYISANGLHLPGWISRTAASAGPGEAAPPAVTVVTGPQAVSKPAGAPAEPAAAPVSGQVSVLLRFATDSWVEIYDGTGKAILYDLGKSGTERSVAGVPPLSVTVGNPAAVAVLVNGRAITPPAMPPGQTVARFTVGADGSVR